MSSNQSKTQVTKNFFSLTAVQIITYVLPLISVPVISRIIGPGKYGIINFATAFISYFNLLITYSFDFTATRKIARDPDNEENRNLVFSEVFLTQFLLLGFSLLIFAVLLYTVPELKENKLVFIYTFFICIAAFFTQNWLFQAMQDLSKVAIFNLAGRLLFTISILLVVRKNDDYVWQPFLIGVIQTCVALWSFTWAYKKYKIKLVKTPLLRRLQVLWEERIIFFSLVCVNLYSYTNTVILGLYQNAEQVGYYTAAQRLIIIAQSVLAMPIAQAFYPFVGKAFGESREEGLKVIHRLVPLIIGFIGLASVFTFILGPFVIQIFYGQKFQPAISAFQILAIVPLLYSLNNVLGIQIMMNLKMDKQFLKITASAGFFSILVNLLMIKQWGYIGSALNWLMTEIFIFVNMYIVLFREGLNPFNAKYFKLSAISEYLQPIKKKFFTRMSKDVN